MLKRCRACHKEVRPERHDPDWKLWKFSTCFRPLKATMESVDPAAWPDLNSVSRSAAVAPVSDACRSRLRCRADYRGYCPVLDSASTTESLMFHSCPTLPRKALKVSVEA